MSARSTTGRTPTPRRGHPVGDRAQDLVGVGDGHRRDHGLAHLLVRLVRGGEHRRPGQDPDKVAVGVEDRVEPLAALG